MSTDYVDFKKLVTRPWMASGMSTWLADLRAAHTPTTTVSMSHPTSDFCMVRLRASSIGIAR
eukprot:785530-Pleurochrysis_carterae.AAC.2